MPRQKPGESKQDYRTPKKFLNAVTKRLKIRRFGLDIAATARNTVATRYFSRRNDAFEQQTWRANKSRGSGWSWLNPEYENIGRWVQRVWQESVLHHAQIAVLIPASVGANWWRDWVHKKAGVLFLNGRITFVGHTEAYPKDCALLLYGPYQSPYYDVWTWNDESHARTTRRTSTTRLVRRLSKSRRRRTDALSKMR